MLRRTYDWMMRLAGSRRAPQALAALAFAESSFFPIPPDVMLAPMVLARPAKAWTYALICTVGSVLGGMLGYAIGYYLTELGHAILAVTGNDGGLDQFKCWYAQWGLWVILIKGLTPIPYKLVTIASGIAQFSFPMFIAASVVTRGARFFLVAWVVKKFGPAMLPVIERRLAWVAGGLIGLVVIGLILSHYLGHGSASAC
ncbi:MAG TPA: YqaA family protein [Caulobacteraceae bacterium]